MRKLLLALALVVFATRAFCLSKAMEFDCVELGPGASQSYLQTFPVKSKLVSELVVEIEASNPGTADAPKCHIKRTVTARLAGKSKILFRHEDDAALAINGVAFDGTSPDGTKLLLDFFTAAGDHTGHRPVVYDFLTSTFELRDLGDRLTRDFPKCDYFTMIQGVTNEGDVVLYVPKSVYVSKGCPELGEWLLNMKTDAITRVPPPSAQSPAPSGKT